MRAYSELLFDSDYLVALGRSIEQTLKQSNRGATAQVAGQSIAQIQSPTQTLTLDSLLRRGGLLLEDGDWGKADAVFDQVLNIDPENARAFIGALCAELKVHCQEDLPSCGTPIADNRKFQRALQFANVDYRAKLTDYALTPTERARNDQQRQEQQVTSSSDLSTFVREAETLPNARAICDAYEARHLNLSSDIDASLRKQLRDYVLVERSYGNAKASVLSILHATLNGIQQTGSSMPPAIAVQDPKQPPGQA